MAGEEPTVWLMLSVVELRAGSELIACDSGETWCVGVQSYKFTIASRD